MKPFYKLVVHILLTYIFLFSVMWMLILVILDPFNINMYISLMICILLAIINFYIISKYIS